MKPRLAIALSTSLLVVMLLLGACSQPSSRASNGLPVVASTTLVADVVKAVGGEHVDVQVLIPANVDEHGYEPSPQDFVKVSRAKVLFLNGAGLEPFAGRIMENAGGSAEMVSVSEGIDLLAGAPDAHADEAENGEHEREEGDPHVWTDPNNVLVWVDNIESALVEADPAHAANYHQNAEQYRRQLQELDGWIREQVGQIPPERRKLVTDHMVFTYFAARYGFEQVGAVIPGYSSLASPSAQDLAALHDKIRDLGVPAVFVGNTSKSAIAERVAQDTQVRLVQVFTGSLTGEDGPAPTYLDYMRYNVNAFVSALK